MSGNKSEEKEKKGIRKDERSRELEKIPKGESIKVKGIWCSI